MLISKYLDELLSEITIQTWGVAMRYNPVTKEPKLYLNNLVDDFGSFREHPTSIKHAKTGQYMLCNGDLAKRDNIPIEEYVGLTSYDVKKIMGWKDSVTMNAVEMDQRISAQKIPYAQYNQVLLAHDKSVVIEEVFKKPVFGSNEQVAAILAYAHNITQHAHPLYLFNLYASYHPKEIAIEHFLRHKNLDTVFEVLPSYEELLTLLAMRDISDVTSIAQSLDYSVQAVKRYQTQLAEKIKAIELHDVLTRLRWYDEDAGYDAIG